jgi:hypothetical protein
LFAAILRWRLENYYAVEEELNLGTKPLQVDYFLLRLLNKDLPEETRKMFAGLAEYLNKFTLIELKSPSDELLPGDFHTVIAYAHLYCGQRNPRMIPSEMNVLVIAPGLTKAFREEFETCGSTATSVEPGIWRLEGGPIIFRMWVFETKILWGEEHPLMSVFSPKILEDVHATQEELLHAGCGDLFTYVIQQIRQFDLLGRNFAMQHSGVDEEMKKILTDIISKWPLEERLKGLSPEERLEGIPTKERLQGLSPEERVQDVSDEDLERLLAKRRAQKNDPNPPTAESE